MKDPNATYFPKGELVYVSRRVNEKNTGEMVLAWKFDIREVTSEKNQRVFINAVSGEKVNSYPLTFFCNSGSVPTTWHGTQTISTSKPGSNYILNDDCGAPNVHTVLEA